MITPQGREKINRLRVLLDGEDLMERFRPEVEKMPAIIAKRVRDGGGNDDKKFSTPYSKSHGKKRSERGLGTGKKDFWFSGDLWRSYKIVKEDATEESVIFYLNVTGENADSDGRKSPRSRPNKEILRGHNERERTHILKPTKSELEDLGNRLGLAFKKFVKGKI